MAWAGPNAWSAASSPGRAGRGRAASASPPRPGISRDPATGGRRFDNSAAHLTAELDGSLARLGLETVDLFYVHRRDQHIPIEEVTETLAGLVQAGKTRAIGFSEIAPSSLRRAAAVHPVAAVQSEYSLWTRAPELGLVQACAALGTALVAFSPVGRGMLTDHPPGEEALARSEFLRGNPRFQEPNLAVNRRMAAGFRELAADMGTSAAALAIAWLCARSPAVIPIPGTRSVAHLRELAAGASLDLSTERPRPYRGGPAGGLGAWRPLHRGAVGRARAVQLSVPQRDMDQKKLAGQFGALRATRWRGGCSTWASRQRIDVALIFLLRSCKSLDIQHRICVGIVVIFLS